MSTPTWVPQAPYSDQPQSTMPPASQALLRRLDAWAARMQAQYPALAEAIRRDAEAQEGGKA